jgi:hypothetical protein
LGANLTNFDAVPLLIHEFGYHPRTLNPDGAPPKVFETRTGDDAPSERLVPSESASEHATLEVRTDLALHETRSRDTPRSRAGQDGLDPIARFERKS